MRLARITAVYLLFILCLVNASPVKADVFQDINNADLAAVRTYLDGGGDPNIADSKGATLLHYAVAADEPDIVELLLSRKANVNAKMNDGSTPLHLAVQLGPPSFGRIIETINIPSDCPVGLALRQDGMLYYSDFNRREIVLFNPHTQQVLGRSPYPDEWPEDIAYDGTSLWALGGKTRMLYRLNASTGVVEAAFPLPGDLPWGIEYIEGRLWEVDANGDITIISPEDGSIVDSVKSLRGQLFGFAWDGSYLWGASGVDKSLCILDIKSKKVVADTKITIEGQGCRGMEFDGERFWVLSYNPPSLNIYRPRKSIMNALRQPLDGQTNAVQFSSGGSTEMVKILLLARADPTIRDEKQQTAHDIATNRDDVKTVAALVDAETTFLGPPSSSPLSAMALAAQFPLPVNIRKVDSIPIPSQCPVGLALRPDGKLYYSDFSRKEIVLFNYKSRKVMWRAPYPDEWAEDIAYDGKSLWALGGKSRKLYRLNPDTGGVKASYPLPGNLPWGLEYAKGQLWEFDSSGDIAVISAKDGSIIRRIDSIRSNIFGLAWDGSCMWGVTGSEKSLYALDLDKETIVAEAKLPVEARGLRGLEFDGKRLWAMNWAPPSQIDIFEFDTLQSDKYKLESKSHKNNSTDYAPPAPDFSLLDLEGRTVKLSDFKGKVVTIILWDWDSRNKDVVYGAVDAAIALTKMPEAKSGELVVLSCTPVPKDDAVRVCRERGYPFRVLLDPTGIVRKQYGVIGRAAMVIDRDGSYVWQRQDAESFGILLATKHALESTPKPIAQIAATIVADTQKNDEVFENFESGFGSWILKGNCWSSEPASDAMYPGRIAGYTGHGFVCTMGESNFSATGMALSKSFTIQHPYIHLLVGGSGVQEHGCISLVVEGVSMRAAAGDEGDILRPICWDVRELQGKTAHFEILDAGDDAIDFRSYVLIDQIVFSDSTAIPDSLLHGFDPDNPVMAREAESRVPQYYRDLRAGNVHTEIIPGSRVKLTRTMKIVWPKDAKDLTCVAAVPPTILAHTVTSASMTLGTGNYTVNTQIIPTDTLLVPNALYARLDPNRVPSRRIDATIMAEAIVNSTKIVPGAINEQAPPLLPADHELLTQSLDPADLEKKFKGWLKENKLIRWSDETEMAFVYRIYCWCQRNCRYTWGSWGGRPSKHAGHFGTVESQTGTCGELAFIMIHILRTNGIPCTMAQGTGHVYVLVYVVGSGWFRIDQPSAMYGYHKGNLDNGIGFDWGPFIHDTHDYPRKYFFPDGPQEGRVFGDVEVCPAWTITEIK